MLILGGLFKVGETGYWSQWIFKCADSVQKKNHVATNRNKETQELHWVLWYLLGEGIWIIFNLLGACSKA